MDIATVFGLIAGWGLVLSAIVMGGNPLMFLNVPSIFIVVGGTLASAFIAFPLSDVIGVIATVKNAFIHKSVQLAIDGTAPELIKDILTTELAFLEDRHALGQSILTTMGAMAPAFGMIGTLIGLVAMLATMDDPSTIGKSMAVALLTTLYGALLANVIFIPCASKLKVRTSTELLSKEIIIEGILSIQSGDNPRVVEQKLKAFISPALREQITIGK